jgi:hypothetical protein
MLPTSLQLAHVSESNFLSWLAVTWGAHEYVRAPLSDGDVENDAFDIVFRASSLASGTFAKTTSVAFRPCTSRRQLQPHADEDETTEPGEVAP